MLFSQPEQHAIVLDKASSYFEGCRACEHERHASRKGADCRVCLEVPHSRLNAFGRDQSYHQIIDILTDKVECLLRRGSVFISHRIFSSIVTIISSFAERKTPSIDTRRLVYSNLSSTVRLRLPRCSYHIEQFLDLFCRECDKFYLEYAPPYVGSGVSGTNLSGRRLWMYRVCDILAAGSGSWFESATILFPQATFHPICRLVSDILDESNGGKGATSCPANRAAWSLIQGQSPGRRREIGNMIDFWNRSVLRNEAVVIAETQGSDHSRLLCGFVTDLLLVERPECLRGDVQPLVGAVLSELNHPAASDLIGRSLRSHHIAGGLTRRENRELHQDNEKGKDTFPCNR